METADAVIAGAGIIGLSLALDLASHGLRVTVLERGRAMGEASWAAAGMLAANDPCNPPGLGRLAQLSLRRYPEYLETIEALSGVKIPIRTRAAIQAVERGAVCSEALSPAEVHRLVPQINANGRRFILLEEPSLDPRDLCAALPIAARAAGVDLRENSPVVSIDARPGQTVVIETSSGPIAARHFVNCAGAWASSPALAIAPGRPLGVAPRKGQIAGVRLRGPEQLDIVLRAPEIYLVPRGDGRVTVGATVERAGFDKTVEPAAIARLLAAAAALWPPIARAEILESWTGMRPYTASELPFIGPVGPLSCGSSAGWEKQPIGHSNLWVAAGHFRNGILLAPATACVLSQAIRGEAAEIDLAPFTPASAFEEEHAALPMPATAATA